MSTRMLFRLAAGALVVGAVTTLVGTAVHPEVDPAAVTSGLWRVSHLLLWVGVLALMVGLIGFYLQQPVEVGRLGAVGTGLAVLAMVARSGAYYVETVVAPELASHATALFAGFPTEEPWLTFRMVSGTSFVMVSVGLVLLCVGVLRAGPAPRWASVMVLVAALLAIPGPGLVAAAPPITTLVVSTSITAALGVGLLGWAVWLWTNAAERRPTGDFAG